jgi:hypothetical protein
VEDAMKADVLADDARNAYVKGRLKANSQFMDRLKMKTHKLSKLHKAWLWSFQLEQIISLVISMETILFNICIVINGGNCALLYFCFCLHSFLGFTALLCSFQEKTVVYS